MATTQVAPMELPEKFSQLAAERVRQSGIEFLQEQMESVLGGISNIYVRRLIERKLAIATVETTDAIVSELALKSDILWQIRYCGGLDTDDQSIVVLDALKSTLRDMFVASQEPTLPLPGIGSFKPVSLEESRYKLTVQDPIVIHEFADPDLVKAEL